MTLLFDNTTIQREPIVSLARILHNDREALLQLLLSMCMSDTFSRIENCPTYPVRIVTSDLEERLKFIRDGLASDPYGISSVLAVLFESATRSDLRKRHGQYFTPMWVARQAIASLALRSGETVLDPGCGTGIFPITILRDAGNRSNAAVSIGYIGVENDPILALSTAVALDWVNAPPNWSVVYANFLSSELGDFHGILKKIDRTRIDAIIANPPFVRFHRLERGKLQRSHRLSEFSGLHAFFLDHSSRLLSHGRMIFITPLEMHGTRYGMELLKGLRSKFDFSGKILYYDGTKHVWQMADLQEVSIEKHAHIRQVWTLMLFQHLSKSNNAKVVSRISKRKEESTVPLAAIARVHRGVSTGANNFFVINDRLVKKIGVPMDHLRKVIPTKIQKARFSNIFKEQDWEKLREEGKSCWLLFLQPNARTDALPQGLRRYIRVGEEHGIPRIPTCRNRKSWYSVSVPLRIPDFFFTYISRGYPRFIYNAARVYNLTNLLGVYLTKPMSLSDSKAEIFVGSLDAEIRDWIDEESVGRKYVGGLIKFEPGDLEKMPIPKSTLEDLELGYVSLESHLE